MENEVNPKTLHANPGRQPELDMAKAILIFCLALVHCTIACSTDEMLLSGIPYFFDSVLGGPMGAPVFIMSMGVGMVYTSKANPKYYIERGCILFVIGEILNIVRYVIPFMVGYLITGDYEFYIENLIYYIFDNDILTFAGLSIILMGLFLTIKLNKWVMLIISIVMSFASLLFNGRDFHSPLINILLSYVIGIEDSAGNVMSDFPVMNWFIILVSGYVFGTFLIDTKDKDRFYLRLSPICFILAMVYFYFGITGARGMFGEGQNCFSHILPWDVFSTILYSFGVLGIYHFICKILPNKLQELIKIISVNINSIYCIHWVILEFVIMDIIYITRGSTYLPIGYTLLIASGISVVSILISCIWRTKWKRKKAY